jgi:GNAT superfamily N-acetyltransferase
VKGGRVRADRRIDAFWAGFFGVPERALAEAGARVVPHAGLGDYAGVWFFVRGGACVVSAPPAWCETLRGALAEESFEALLSEDALRALFGESFRGTVGPAYQGWLDPGRFRPRPSPAVRAIAPGDARAIESLRAACSEDDWRDADLRLDGPGAFGCFEGGELVAAASLTPWGEGVAGPGVLARPRHRGRGCGAAAVSAAVERALGAGDLVVYQTLMSNSPAVGIATALGFARYASHLAVRLQGPPARRSGPDDDR